MREAKNHAAKSAKPPTSTAKEAKSINVVDALLSVACPPPVIPVKVYQDADDQWKKEPLRKWNDASTDRDVLEGWWQQWPSALPGIPLKQVGWVAIDLTTQRTKLSRPCGANQ